ncbi:hypothetical protein Tco_1351777 [Tanacetum coccineum]
MELCTNLQQRVLDLETTKTTQANEIASLKRRVKKLERRNKSRTHRLKIMYKVGSSRRIESSKDKDLGEDASKQGRRINAVNADEDITPVTDVEVTLAQALAELKSEKPKAVKDKGKGIMIEEPVVEQAKIKADYQLAQRLQEELTDDKKTRLFVQFLKQRRKHFEAKRVEEKRNRPPARAQQRSIMCTYLKNMKG